MLALTVNNALGEPDILVLGALFTCHPSLGKSPKPLASALGDCRNTVYLGSPIFVTAEGFELLENRTYSTVVAI